jgi:hypothetical protein
MSLLVWTTPATWLTSRPWRREPALFQRPLRANHGTEQHLIFVEDARPAFHHHLVRRVFGWVEAAAEATAVDKCIAVTASATRVTA